MKSNAQSTNLHRGKLVTGNYDVFLEGAADFTSAVCDSTCRIFATWSAPREIDPVKTSV